MSLPTLPLFTESEHCTSRIHCARCRNLFRGKEWRASLRNHFALPEDKTDFPCPAGLAWNGPKPAAIPQQAPSLPQFDGPAKWRQLHRRALAYVIGGPAAAAEKTWLNIFAAGLSVWGCTCKSHWQAMLAKHPADLSSAEGYFAWTVLMHNLVNENLGKPKISPADALKRWTDADN